MKWNKRPTLLLVLGALTAMAATAVVAGVGTAAIQVAPSNTAPPTISGTARVGSTFTANRGTWTGTGTITYAYQWQRCNQDGGSCSNISGANEQTYTLQGVDADDTLRVRVTATNSDGSTSATSVPSPRVQQAPAATTTGATTTTAAPTATGCLPSGGSQAGNVTDVKSPSRLQIRSFNASVSAIGRGTETFSVRFTVTDTCGNLVRGALVNAAAVPYQQYTVEQGTTGTDGSVTLQFQQMRYFPASARQQLLVMFVRATKPGEDQLAGASTRRLISLPVNLRG